MSTTSGNSEAQSPRNATRNVVQNMFQVDDYRWLCSEVAKRYWSELGLNAECRSEVLLKKLRASLPIQHAALLVEQLELQTLAKRKFADSPKWFWTKQLLEQSSDHETGMETASDFPSDSQVVDICCGAGADAIAIAERSCHVTAIDRCPIACELTRYNAKSHGFSIRVLDQSAEETEVSADSFIHVDPDRRADGSRSSSLDRLSPSWETVLQLLGKCRGMSLKLAPGTRVEWQGLKHRTDRSPQAVRFLSKDGSVRQQRWYWGIDRWPNDSITASMRLNAPSTLRASKMAVPMSEQMALDTRWNSTSHGWFHETFLVSDKRLNECLFTIAPKDFVADYDPSIRAAEMSVRFAERYGWELIDSDSGYLTSKNPTTHPMVRWFKVLENLPLDTKRIKAYAKSLSVHTWELKSRGLEVDLNGLRRILPCDATSERTMTILCTKLGKSHRAIFCEECEIE